MPKLAHNSATEADRYHGGLLPGLDGLVCPRCPFRVEGAQIPRWKAELIRWRTSGRPTLLRVSPIDPSTVSVN